MNNENIIEHNDNNKNNENNINTWDDLNLKYDLLRGIYAYGFEKPSDIQKKAIFPIINGKDTIAQAQSGTGKTGTFAISALERVDTSNKNTQVIIIAPTHELVKQIYNVILTLGNNMNDLSIKTIIGGTSIQDDVSEMRKKCPQIIVGTAGRVFDMIKRRYIRTKHMKLFILDEADEMLSKGFKDQIYNIFQHFNNDIQVAIFSATIPIEVLNLTNKFMNEPVKIILKNEELSLDGIQQYFLACVSDNDKFNMLKNLFSFISIAQCIIYCNNVICVNELQNAMNKEGFSVCSIHSSMDKSKREIAFNNFRSGSYRVLISSNVTARGIDIQQVSTVINFDIPKCVHTYLHRIGRSGRWGRKGLAINFVTHNDIQHMRTIEKYYQISINELPNDVKKLL
jgi:translation initiation factor 4A